ncbi:MAG: amidohydrolase [Desulfovibrionales bacterium]|nr:MAG: amidohydrolase [Desulfovibrionales bacterium]
MSILIKNVLHDGSLVDVAIQGEEIAQIGPNLSSVAAETVIDGTDKAIVPSLINAHTHAAMTLLRGYADDMELHEWLQNHIWPMEHKLTREDVYWGAKLACLEMIKTGTTFFCDMYWHMGSTIRAVEDMGLRAMLSSVFIDFGDPKKIAHFKTRTREFFAQQNTSTSRVQFALGPHAIYTVSRESLIWLAEFAREHNLLIHIHLSETKREVDDCVAAHGTTPVRYLRDIGFLGPNILAAHAIWLDDQEMDLLAEYDVKIAHLPISNTKLCSGSFPYRRLHARGVCIGLGTDGCSSNNNLDMFEEMKFATLKRKAMTNDPTAMPAAEVWQCATVNGARIFGLNAGRIAPGMLADCLLLDLNHPQLVPNHNLISNMVYAANGDCVDTTICAGKILMRDRHVPGERDIVQEVKARVDALLRR